MQNQSLLKVSQPIYGWMVSMHGAAYAVIETTARLVAAGANWSKARFSYQEWFQADGQKQSPEHFSQPMALLF